MRERLIGRALVLAMVAGLTFGMLGATPLEADEEACLGSGCCQYTVNCGSPSEVRCCLPKSGEAACNQDPCPNYCFGQPSCGAVLD